MKELKGLKTKYLENYDVEVNQYLTFSQIQEIINSVLQSETFEERENTIDYLLLVFCTNIGKEKVDELGPDIFVESGLIDEVKNSIKNINKLYEGITYHESTGKALREISKLLPDYLEEMKENGILK